VSLRQWLTGKGLDAGPATIAWHLEQEGLHSPSTSTIRRILHTAGLVIPEPRKRPKSSYIRFEAAQPNETWQSDFTHWRLADGTDIHLDTAEIIATNTINPERTYWRNQMKEPGRWPGS
jgi:transposase InsO family protein